MGKYHSNVPLKLYLTLLGLPHQHIVIKRTIYSIFGLLTQTFLLDPNLPQDLWSHGPYLFATLVFTTPNLMRGICPIMRFLDYFNSKRFKPPYIFEIPKSLIPNISGTQNFFGKPNLQGPKHKRTFRNPIQLMNIEMMMSVNS